MFSSVAKKPTSSLMSEFDKELDSFDSAVSSFSSSSSKSFSSASTYTSMTNSDGVTVESEENHEAKRELNTTKRSGEEAQTAGFEAESYNKASWDSRTGVTQSEATSSSNKLGNADAMCIEQGSDIDGLIMRMNSEMMSVGGIDESLKATASQSVQESSRKMVSESQSENRVSSEVAARLSNVQKTESSSSVTSQTQSVQSAVAESSIDTEQRNFQDLKKVFAQNQLARASPELRQPSPPSAQRKPIIDTVDLLPRQVEDEIVMLENVHPFTPNDIEIILTQQTRKITLEAHREEKTSDGGTILHSVSRYWTVPLSMEFSQMRCFVDARGQLVLTTKIVSDATRIQIVNEGQRQQQRTETSEIVEEAIRPSDVRKKFERIAEQEKSNLQKQYIKINPTSSPVYRAATQVDETSTPTVSLPAPRSGSPKTHLTTATMYVSAPQEKSVASQQEERTSLQNTFTSAKQSVASAQELLSERHDHRSLEEEMRNQSQRVVSNQDSHSQIQTGRSNLDFMSECESEFRKIQQSAERAMQMNFGSFMDEFDSDVRVSALESSRRSNLDSFFGDDFNSRSLRSRSAVERANFGSLFHDMDSETRVPKVEQQVIQQQEQLKFTVNVGGCREDQLRVKLISCRLVLEAEWEEGYSRRSIRREWTLPSSVAPEQIKCTLSSDGVLVITCGN